MRKYQGKTIAMLLVTTMLVSMTGCGVTIEGADSKTEQAAVNQENAENTETSKKENEGTTVTIRPQDDFYGAINKEVLDQYNPNYKDLGAGVAYDMQECVDQETFAMIKEIVGSQENFEKGSCEAIVKEAYEQTLQYMKDKQSRAIDVFLENKQEIENAENIDELLAVMKTLTAKQGTRLYFLPSIDYNYKTGDSYALYFDQLEMVAEMSLKDLFEKDEDQEALHSFAKRLLIDLGEDKETAGQKADDYIYMVLDIASQTNFELAEVDNPFLAYEYKTSEECDEILNPVKSVQIEELYDFKNPYGGWCVQDEAQLKMLASKFTNDNLETVKTFLLCELAMEYKNFLADKYSVFSAYSTDNIAKQEEHAVLYINSILPDQVSELYEKYYFTEQMQSDFQTMYEDIIVSYEKLINDARWISQDTREGFLRKLHSIVFVPGGARKTEANEVTVAKDPFDTYCNAKKAVLNRYRKMIGTEIDKSVSVMNANVVNAGYSPINTFTVTVAIAHAPYYNENASYAENLGGLGMVMAHEIGHGFDSNCMVWDENGKYNPEWISEEDQKKMKNQIQRFEEYYSDYKVLEVYSVDGKKTSGENFADVGAMECVTSIVKTQEEKKKLFENYARIWCQLSVDTDVVELLNLDEHSPAMVRTNAVLSSINDFYEVYGVIETDGMYKKPEERVSRWREER